MSRRGRRSTSLPQKPANVQRVEGMLDEARAQRQALIFSRCRIAAGCEIRVGELAGGLYANREIDQFLQQMIASRGQISESK